MKNAMTIIGLAGLVSLNASAATVDATITADNHYALYTSHGGVMTQIGGNELDAGGSPGTYNWSLPETYHFDAGEYIYIAAWSDKSVAQGLLANIAIDGMGTMNSGDPRWQVMTTGIIKGDGSAQPAAEEIGAFSALADSNSLWEVPFVGGANGIDPWGTIPGIDNLAQWMWRNSGGPDPIHGGQDAGEYLIFRAPVPAPGSLAIAGFAGLVGARRRKR